jgi:uncharacterized protein
MQKRIETNLNRIRKLAKAREDENWDFRSYLKQRDDAEVDGLVHEILEEVTAAIDCTQCANCCIALGTCVTPDDIRRLAGALDITEQAFKAEFVKEDDVGPILGGKPCAFLKDKRCSVYEHRPADCADYPNLHKDGFVFRLMSVVNNCAVCPIVFNVYECLKDEMGYRRRKRGRR